VLQCFDLFHHNKSVSDNFHILFDAFQLRKSFFTSYGVFQLNDCTTIRKREIGHVPKIEATSAPTATLTLILSKEEMIFKKFFGKFLGLGAKTVPDVARDVSKNVAHHLWNISKFNENATNP
jgi:hypothetical protein